MKGPKIYPFLFTVYSSLVSSLQLSSVSLELVDSGRVESVEIQPDTAPVICVKNQEFLFSFQSSLTCEAR